MLVASVRAALASAPNVRPTARHFLLALAVMLAACGGGSSSRPISGRDGAIDLRPSEKLDGKAIPDISIGADRAPDWSPADGLGAIPDLASDLGSRADLVRGETTSGANDVAADGAPDGSVNGALDGSGQAVDGGCGLAEGLSLALLPSISFAAYHSQQEISDYLQAVAAAVPAVAQYKVLGQSVQGRNLPYLLINATCQANPPAVFLNGTHHGDEPSSTEAVLAVPDYLLRGSATDSAVRSLLGSYAFYLLPLVNPDGHALNTRANADGVDINRDYSYPGRSDGDSFATVEARLVKSLQESVGFKAAIAYHSGAQEVIWPWCYTGDVTPDDSLFTSAGRLAAQAMNFTVYQQSYDDYPTTGEYIDYAYWKSHTLSATFEVSTVKAPVEASLVGVVGAAWKGTLAWIQAASDHDKRGAQVSLARIEPRRKFPLTAPFDGTNRLE
jgi:hypothetical protein